MCNPLLLATGAQLASGAIQARNEVAAGNAQNSYYQFMANQNVQQAEMVRKTGEAQSRVIQDVAKTQGRAQAEDAAKLRSSQKAALATAGVSGVTSEDVAKDTYRTQLLDEAMLRYNADVNSYQATEGAKANAYGLESQAQGFRYAGANAKAAGKRNAFSTILGTAVSIANPFASSKFAIPGLGGYGLKTPIGTKNMGTFSRLRGR